MFKVNTNKYLFGANSGKHRQEEPTFYPKLYSEYQGMPAIHRENLCQNQEHLHKVSDYKHSLLPGSSSSYSFLK